MSRIDDLIAEHCPNGVEYRKLGKAVRIITTGKLNANAMVENGAYPFFTCDANPFKIDTYAFDTEAIIISGNGSQVGHINYYKGKFNAYQRTYVVSECDTDLSIHYLLFYLKAYLRDYIFQNSRKGSVPYITMPMLQEFTFPVPPLPVQQEIVDILDTFTKLEAELEAELEARRQQYAHYRNALLSFTEIGRNVERESDTVRWRPLGEVGMFVRGNGLQKKDFTETGVGCIHYGQIYTHYGVYADETKTFTSESLAKKLRKAKKGDLVIATTSENDEDVCKAVAWLGDEDIAVSGDAYIYQHSLNPKYVAYFFMTDEFQRQKRPFITGTKVRRVSGDNMSKIKIPVPPLEEQNRIVSILDKFDALVNDISSGLPAEITARRQQYEHYRNKLLTFQEAA